MLRVSNPQNEGVYQAAKWLKIHALLSKEEMASLLAALNPFWIFPLTGIVDGNPIKQSFFLDQYGAFVEGLQKGSIPDAKKLRQILPVGFIDDLSVLWIQEVAGGKKLCKIGKPIVQVQAHFFSYSRLDRVFRPMALGQDTIFWGVQFAFPQVYQDPKTMELLDVENSTLFRKIQRWMRDGSQPTPFLVDGERINSPIRIGKTSLSWIHKHPQLLEQKIQIYG